MLAFFQFFVSIFGSYRRHLTDVGTHTTFDGERFRKSHAASTRDFLDSFTSAQMFRQWQQERVGEAVIPIDDAGSFEEASYQIHQIYIQNEAKRAMELEDRS